MKIKLERSWPIRARIRFNRSFSLVPSPLLKGRGQGEGFLIACARLTSLIFLLAIWATPIDLYGQDDIQFNRDIRPILANNCFACHGLDAGHRQADLRLDTAEGAMADHSGTAAVVPNDLDNSELWIRITAEEESERMPPADSNKVLTDDEKQLLKRWIAEGAPYAKHWSFEPPVAVAPPQMNGISVSPIDAFIADRLSRDRLTMSAEADKHILIRRLAFALTGLPPTPAEVDEYFADHSPDAYEKLVDRYLASKHFGEEMARHWLDVARYADTHGLHLDNERQMWAYRDWIVRCFNTNKPFDEFTVEQLAGDLLPQPSVEQLIATGFNRCNVTSSEGGSIDAELLYRYAVDRTSTASQTWMGLTAGCAVCHDHKFDPISQREFYSLYAFFNSAADPPMDGNALLTDPVMKLAGDEDRQKLSELDAKLAALQRQVDERAAQITYLDPADAQPPPEATTVESLWMDDDFPAGGHAQGSPGHPTTFVTVADGGQVLSGQRALKRSDPGLSQDVWDQATVPLIVPNNGIIFAYVFIAPETLPRSIMLQFYKNGWLHRAVWGDYEVIDWGAKNTTERVAMGPLPEAGKWIRLEVPVEKIGLKSGDQLTGFATTQYGGTIFWDKVGVVGASDPANDSQRSFAAWWKQTAGKDTTGLAADLNAVAKAGPESNPDAPARARLLAYYVHSICADTRPQFAELDGEIVRVTAERDTLNNAIPSTFIYRDIAQPRESFVMLRGQYDKPGEKVEPAVPAILPPLNKADQQGRATRLDFAKWLVSPEHPLTSRVAVNRFWQQFFGTGLVKSSGDFGTQGELPSHPELLDWMAIHFRDSGWDVKSLVRMVVTSSAFRQSSRVPSELYSRDPENRLLARGPRLRLDAEQIRDNALFVSGLINLEIGGKGVKPYQPANIWEPVGFAGSNTRFYQQDEGAALYRRSLYTFYKRTAPPPFMVNFDAPNREQSCTRRERSNTPLQALQLMNDVQHVEAARSMAQRMLTQGGSSADERIAFAYQTVLARAPDAQELELLNEQLTKHLARYQQSPDDATKLIMQGQSKPLAALTAPELAAYTLVASTILNLDETLTRN